MTTAMILILVLSASVFAAIVGLISWAIATAHHDHHAMMSGWPHHRTPRARHDRDHERRSPHASGRPSHRARPPARVLSD